MRKGGVLVGLWCGNLREKDHVECPDLDRNTYQSEFSRYLLEERGRD